MCCQFVVVCLSVRLLHCLRYSLIYFFAMKYSALIAGLQKSDGILCFGCFSLQRCYLTVICRRLSYTQFTTTLTKIVRAL